MENITGELIISEVKRPPLWRRRIMAGVLGSVVLFGFQNHETLRHVATAPMNGNLVPDIDECNDFPDEYREIPLANEEERVADVESAARIYEAEATIPEKVMATTEYVSSMNILDTYKTVTDFFEHPQESYTSEYSGVEFQFYSDVADADWTIHHQRFDEAFHFGVLEDVAYEHPQIEYVTNCIRQRVLSDLEFAGETYHVYIPSNSNTCSASLRLVDKDIEPDIDCEQRGFTPFPIDARFGGHEIFSGNIMILTGGSNAGPVSADSFERLTRHEGIHAHTVLAGIEKFHMDPNEKWVKYQERHMYANPDAQSRQPQPIVSWSRKD